jgi:hypothetical protein
MKRPLANKITLSLNESLSESDSDAFETITLRPNEDVSAMIGALNELLRQPVSTLFVDEISERLCELILKSKDNHSLVQGLIDEPPQHGSAMALLASSGAIRELHDPVHFDFST